MRSRTIIRVGLLAAILAVAACQQMDPYTRTDTWQPSGANAGNISAMVANPYDLIRGRGVDKVDSRESGIAINHIWNDTPKGLLDPGGGSGGGGGGSGGGGSGSSGGGGGGGSGGGSSGSGG
jgi:hypothetical protein